MAEMARVWALLQALRPTVPPLPSPLDCLVPSRSTAKETEGDSASLVEAVDAAVALARVSKTAAAASLLSSSLSSAAAAAEETVAEDYLRFVAETDELKATEASIPRAVLPSRYSNAVLIDVRVAPRRRVPDDVVYMAHEAIRCRVARGNVVLSYRDNAAERKISRMVLQSLRKFTGGPGDEDDDEDIVDDAGTRARWHRFFLGRPEDADSVVVMGKANGEAAHLAVLWMEDRFVLVSGSKNVHLATTTRGDVAHYSDGRFTTAVCVTQAVYDMLEAMGSLASDRLLGFLAGTGLTATFELLQPTYQHVEVLENASPELCFIAWTRPDPLGQSDSLTLFHPAINIELARHLKLKTVPMTIISPADIPTALANTRHMHGKEGVVMYYVDSQGRTMGLIKRKSVWYVAVRACREKVRPTVGGLLKMASHCWPTELPTLVERCQRRMHKRLEEIAAWLDIEPERRKAWQELTDRFIEWCLYAVAVAEGGRLVRGPDVKGEPITNQRVQELFPLVWRQFLEEHDLDDNI